MDRNKVLREIDRRMALFGTFFAFSNKLQAAGDTFYEEITCKQFYLLIALSLFGEQPPTINELAEVMGSSHQNVKQIVNKLEEKGFLNVYQDEEDRRKLRIKTTEKKRQFGERYQAQEQEFLDRFYDGIKEEEITVVLEVLLKLENNLGKIREEED